MNNLSQRVWTSSQKNAIESTGGSVLVSAAAGSGKTSVLTERVIKKVTNKSNPTDINNFLIVTFTNLAAQEMKSRISARLSQMITQNPSDLNLQRQKNLLKITQIGTIHKFCLNLVKENFYKLGMPPKFKIIKENELKTIKFKSMENTLNHFFDENSPAFKKVADLFSDEKNDNKLSNVIEQIYYFTRSLPFPEKWMQEKLDMYNPKNNAASIWESFVFEHAIQVMAELLEILNSAVALSKSNDITDKAYTKTLQDDINNINNALNTAKTKNLENTSQALNNIAFGTLKPIRDKTIAAEKQIIQEKRGIVKVSIKKLLDYFEFGTKNTKEDTKIIHEILSQTFKAVKYYADEIESMKLLKNAVDFSDLEHKTIELLTEEHDGKIVQSDLAKEISKKFTEVMVDEYQDINEVQSTIFKMITNGEKNIFMVGDVKQSIYGFRKSRPQIFLDKNSKYTLFDSQNPKYPAKILLGNNFRSSKKIIDGINFIFENLMSKKTAEIDYTEDERLIPGLNENDDKNTESAISIKILDDPESSDEAEAYEIAKTIAKMIGEKYQIVEHGNARPVEFKDFCVLLRNFSSHADVYAKVLYECGIPTYAESNEKFLGTTEIMNILSFLSAINNPLDDISLIASMVGPIFQFEMDKIADIRATDKNNGFYFNLKNFSENNPQNLKIKNFLDTLEHYRTLSTIMPCDELIEIIYSETGYFAICGSEKDGKLKKANLMAFLEYAGNFEKEYHNGLSGFLSLIREIKDKGEDLPAANISTEPENTVKILSVHKSKGLEFPVCILAGCSKKFKTDKSQIMIHPELGIGFKLKNQDGTIIRDNLIRKAISLKNKEENIAEEMRILYVALTRAKQKLILVASLNKVSSSIITKLASVDITKAISPFIIQTSSSFFDWILLCISKSNLRNKLCSAAEIPEFISQNPTKETLDWSIDVINSADDELTETTESSEQESEIKNNEEQENIIIDKVFLDTLNSRLEFNYSDTELSALPVKVSASELAGEEMAEKYIASSRPEFMNQKGITPLTRGNAMHKFVCYSDLKNLTFENAMQQAKSLKQRRFLTEREFNALNISAIKKFAASDLVKRISKSPKVLREHRFSVQIPASVIFTDLNLKSDRLIMVQGAIDCAFEENGEFVIIDYKTDIADNATEIYQKYEKQLKIYKYALEKIYSKKVKEIGIYSFYLGQYFGNAS